MVAGRSPQRVQALFGPVLQATFSGLSADPGLGAGERGVWGSPLRSWVWR